MQKLQHFLLAVLCTAQSVNISTGELQCSGGTSDNHQISLSVNSRRSDGGEWMTSFLAHRNTSHQLRDIDVDVKRNSVICQGNHIIQIGGFLKDMPQEQNNTVLTFKRCSKNAAITSNGRTLQKLKLDEHGSGFTNRPLMDDEIFTVRIDGKGGNFNEGLGIGLSQLILEGEDLKNHNNHYKSGTWMFYGISLYQNGAAVIGNYLKKSLTSLQVGQTVGVMRSKFGTLHLFIDGIDQGPAASNIPHNTYGVFELYGNVIKGSIVDV